MKKPTLKSFVNDQRHIAPEAQNQSTHPKKGVKPVISNLFSIRPG